jgi:hypothetical protein
LLCWFIVFGSCHKRFVAGIVLLFSSAVKPAHCRGQEWVVFPWFNASYRKKGKMSVSG